jgi:hypothetical protein
MLKGEEGLPGVDRVIVCVSGVDIVSGRRVLIWTNVFTISNVIVDKLENTLNTSERKARGITYLMIIINIDDGCHRVNDEKRQQIQLKRTQLFIDSLETRTNIVTTVETLVGGPSITNVHRNIGINEVAEEKHKVGREIFRESKCCIGAVQGVFSKDGFGLL